MPSLLTKLAAALARPPEAKASRAGALIAMHAVGRPRWTSREAAALAREGFERNAIVYRCVRMTAEAAATIPWRLHRGRAELIEHPLLDLLRKPNPREDGASFLEAVFGHLMVSGDAYVEAALIDGAPRELFALRPDRMQIVPGADGWPQAYDYVVGAERARFDMTQDGVKPILHMKMFSPLDDHNGLAPIAAAQVALDIHNAASAWNKALLDNAARPSGALVYAGEAGHLSDDQFERLKRELEESFQGPRNAGRPLLLEGGLDWKPLSLTPKDMDFMAAKAGAAREIALALGVPPLLLGLPGDNTRANYAEAHRAFWRQTVIPLANRTLRAFETWLTPAYESGLRFELDLDRLDALAEERAQEWARLEAASFLTRDEKREAAGYAAQGEREAKEYDPNQPRAPAGGPEGGQWISGEEGGEASLIPAQFNGDELYQIDLRGEEVQGGHAIARHVNKSAETLKKYVRDTLADPLTGHFKENIRAGSFTSIEAANKLVNSTLAQNRAIVEMVARGAIHRVRVDAYFASRTGIEAYARTERSEPIVRDTIGVGVLIQHRPEARNQFRVITAYPRNP